jgi:2-phosphosulfolactate phosphatase
MRAWQHTQSLIMIIQKIHRQDPHLVEGLVVVIDVIRAFTTAAYAFHKGAKEILIVKDVEEAFQLYDKYPDYLLMGEVGGKKIEGFHFGNSPYEISKQDLAGKTLIQRTSSGTQGIALCKGKDNRVLASSFVVAKATCKRIKQLNPAIVSLMSTGSGSEDQALADYLEVLLKEGSTDHLPYIEQVTTSPTASRNPPEDIDACAQLDTFDFAMEVFSEGECQVLKKVQ